MINENIILLFLLLSEHFCIDANEYELLWQNTRFLN